MALITVTAARVRPVLIIEEATKPALVAVTRGQVVALDATTGKWRLADSTSAGQVGARRGFALRDVGIGESLTALTKGILDIGDGLSAMNFGDSIFLNDTAGSIGTAAGTVSSIAAFVDSVWAAGASADKLARVDL